MRIAFATTTGESAQAFLLGHIDYLRALGHDVVLISSPDMNIQQVCATRGVSFTPLQQSRSISPSKDLGSLTQAIRLLRRIRPDVVIYGTPKAALIFSVASVVARVPSRLHIVHGFRYPTMSGAGRVAVRTFEAMPAWLATRVLVVSPSLKRQLTASGVSARRISVIHNGSIGGIRIDTDQCPGPRPSSAGDHQVVGFVGRLSPDKGLDELIEAFERVRQCGFPEVRLTLFGNVDAAAPLADQTVNRIEVNPHIKSTGFIFDVRRRIRDVDILVLPTRRDGFGVVCLEAAAEGVPVICSEAAGAVGPLIRDGVSGLTYPVGDVAALTAALCRLLGDPLYARHLAVGAYTIAKADFREEDVQGFLSRQITNLPPEKGSMGNPDTWYARRGKRAFDLLLGGLALVVTFPAQATVAALIRRNLGSPVLFRQVRPGRDEQRFEMIKFRTMTDERGSHGELLPDAERLPPFGRFLRSTSLDELPELLSVIKGDMSLVGPRPLLAKYLPLYTPRQRLRHTVRPGITGWAQVNGRNNASWEEKFELDVAYVENISFRLDLKILALTLLQVLRRRDVVAEGHATAPEFEGSQPTA